MEVKKRQLKLGWRGSCLLLVSYQHIIYCNYKAIIFILIPAAKTTPQKDLKQDSAANTNDQTKSDIAPTKSISKDSECMKQESPKNVEIPPAGPAEVKISETSTSQNSGKTMTAAAVDTADQASIPAPAADPAPAPATVPAAPSDPAPAVSEAPAANPAPSPAPVKAPTPAASAQVAPSASVTPPTPSLPPASTAMVPDVTEPTVSASEVQTPTISQPSAPVARAGTRRVPPGGHCSGGFW